MYICSHIGIARIENKEESRVVISTSPNLCNSFVDLEKKDYSKLLQQIEMFGSAYIGFQYLRNNKLLEMVLEKDGSISVVNFNNETVKLGSDWFAELEYLIKRKAASYDNLKVIH